MEEFISSVEASIQFENWHSALAVALTLPDICLSFEPEYQGNGAHKKRYIEFHRRYIERNYMMTSRSNFLETAQWLENKTKLVAKLAAEGNFADILGAGGPPPDPVYETRCLFPAEDFFGLRCAVLHDGTHVQSIKSGRYYGGFKITIPKNGNFIHANAGGEGEILQLQVDILCHEICAGVRQWDSEYGETYAAAKNERLLRFS